MPKVQPKGHPCLSSEVKNHKFVNAKCKCHETSKDLVLVTNSVTVPTGGKQVKFEIRWVYSMEGENRCRKGPAHWAW